MRATSRTPSLRAAVALLTVSGFLCAPATATGSGPGDEAPARGLEHVLEELEDIRRPSAGALLDALLASGPRGWRELLAALEDPDQPLGAQLGRSLLTALAELPELVLDRRQAGERQGRQLALELSLALSVLEGFGGAGDLDHVIRLGLPEERDQALDLRLLGDVEDCLAALLRRDSEAFGVLGRGFTALDPRIQPVVLRAVGRVEDRRAVTFLSDRLGLDERLDPLVLAQLGRAAARVGVDVDERTRTFVLMGLRSADAQLRGEACLVAGHLEDSEAVPDLIDLLEDPGQGVSANAYWALRRCTRKYLDPVVDRWRRWYAKEQAWWSSEAADCLRDLHSADPGRVSLALRELATHRLHRHELARELLPLLGETEEALLLQVCGALQALGSRVSRPALRGLLEHPSAAVRGRVELALDAIAEPR